MEAALATEWRKPGNLSPSTSSLTCAKGGDGDGSCADGTVEAVHAPHSTKESKRCQSNQRDGGKERDDDGGSCSGSGWRRLAVLGPPSFDENNNYLVDPASSHMLVSKIKPCMCQYTPTLRQNREWLIKSVMIH